MYRDQLRKVASLKKPWLITFGVIAFVVALVVVLLSQRQKPYDLVALSLANALLVGDMDVIDRHLFEQEVKLAGYTPEKLQAIWARVIEPSLSGAKVVGTERDLNESYGSANQVLKFPDGRTGSLQIVVYATDDGPKMLFSPHIYYAWQRRKATNASLEASRRAILEGVTADGRFLQENGINGYVDFNIVEMNGPPEFSIKTWQEVRRRAEEHLGVRAR
jgi:hypothetical protein